MIYKGNIIYIVILYDYFTCNQLEYDINYCVDEV